MIVSWRTVALVVLTAAVSACVVVGAVVLVMSAVHREFPHY